MSARRRALFAGMTDYTGVPMEDILSHLRDWRDQTVGCIEALYGFERDVEAHRDQLDLPDEIVGYIEFFMDLFGRYAGDFERLLVELPKVVTEAHVETVRQIYDSAVLEESRGSRFARDHVEDGLKDEGPRWLVDGIYQQSAGMLVDYHDLSNLAPRLRALAGTSSVVEVELEQKFHILRSPNQRERDFDAWTTHGSPTPEFSIGVIFFDIDDFKRLNSRLTESVVDQVILAPLQRQIHDMTLCKGAAYRHGGEEFVVMLPNCTIDETAAFAEGLRARIDAQVFAVKEGEPVQLTVSVGVAAWPLHGGTLQDVIVAANKAENEAKAAGKNRVHTAPT